MSTKNKTKNLKLPQYQNDDLFDMKEVNEAYKIIDESYKEQNDNYKQAIETSTINGAIDNLELIDARKGKRTLGEKISEIDNKANKVDLTIEDYMNLKYGKDSYIEINKNINKLLNVKIDKSLLSKKDIETNINIKMSFLSSGNNLFKTMKDLISIDNNIRFI